MRFNSWSARTLRSIAALPLCLALAAMSAASAEVPDAPQALPASAAATPSKLDYLILASVADGSNLLAMSAHHLVSAATSDAQPVNVQPVRDATTRDSTSSNSVRPIAAARCVGMPLERDEQSKSPEAAKSVGG